MFRSTGNHKYCFSDNLLVPFITASLSQSLLLCQLHVCVQSNMSNTSYSVSSLG